MFLDRVLAVTVAVLALVWRLLYDAVLVPVDRGLRGTKRLSALSRI